MICIPELKAGEQPFDPDFDQAMTPWKEKGAGKIPAASILTLEDAPPAHATSPEERTPEQQNEMILNLAVVKERITALHREEDEALRRAEEIRSTAICDITAEHGKFLKERLAAGENACKNEEQKALFRAMTAAFSAQSRERAEALRQRKTLEYWRQTVEEQNREFLDRALRPENAGSDAAIAMYRDLILCNMRNMLASAPATQRNALIRTAKAAFYEKVLEKRLENDPAGTQALAEQAGMRSLLGDAACDELAKKAAKALREEQGAATARAWAEEGLDPAAAEARAEAAFREEEERKRAVDCYRAARFAENRALAAARQANTARVWEALREGGYDERDIPLWVVRNEPGFADCLRACLRGRGDAGGGEGKVEYGAVMGFFDRFMREGLWRTLEALRGEEAFHALLVAAGGPEGELWGYVVRFLLGEADGEDKEFLAALRAEWGEGRSAEEMDAFRFRRKKDEEQEYNTMKQSRLIEKPVQASAI